MKHLLENLKKELDKCEETHALAEGRLHGMEHDDEAIAYIWNVLSALVELQIAQGECLHHHLSMHHGVAQTTTTVGRQVI